MQVLTLILVVFCTLATWLPVIKTHQWWIRVFDFPKLQITVLAIIALGLAFFFLYNTSYFYVVLAIMLISIINQSVAIIKYTPFYPIRSEKAVLPQKSNIFSMVVSNVKMDNEKYSDYLHIIDKAKPDIILLTEVNDKWTEEIKELEKIYPYQIKYPLPNTYGISLYSKFKLHDTEINFLVEKDIPSIYTKVELASGNRVALHCIHPEPPKVGSDTYERDTEILLIGQRIIKENVPCVVIGDLNDVAWSYTSRLFQKRCQLMDPREGRGFYNTYNVFVPLMRYPLDHFFYSKDFRYIRLKKLEAFGSDHFPMMLRLEYVSED